MKIKLVTFAPNPNFGTCLQSYALNYVLCKMGHDVEFIYNGHESKGTGIRGVMKKIVISLLPKSTVKRIQLNRDYTAHESLTTGKPDILELPNNYFHYWLSKLPFYSFVYRTLKFRSKQKRKVYTFMFEDGNYKMRRAFLKREYDEIAKDADIFITGSDQIWNPYCGGFNPLMFLEVAGNKKRVAYSSSIARPEFPSEVRERAKNDLGKFQYIGVRETSSVAMLKGLLGRDDIRLVVDPTYLLSRNEWKDFASRAKLEFDLPAHYIFCYFIGGRYREYMSMVEDVKKQTGIDDVITIDCTGSYINYGEGFLYKDGGPYEFVYLLSHASMVCMDSFHATVFALKFGVDFVHILKTKNNQSSESQNSRMFDLFKRYGLDYKLYTAQNTKWLEPIDFQRVNEIIEREISESLDFLEQEIYG